MAVGSEFRPNNRQKKLLALVYLLEKRGKMATIDGLIKIARGEEDGETLFLKGEPGYGCLLSLRGKQAKLSSHGLVREGYLRQVYVDGDYFLRLTPKGEEIAQQWAPRLGSAIKESKPTIIDIERKQSE
ncbi:MAG: hypothetical protein Q4F15_03135 [Bacillota bacterium]|nr:hypothetical protein [Bacillota bacterium]